MNIEEIIDRLRTVQDYGLNRQECINLANEIAESNGLQVVHVIPNTPAAIMQQQEQIPVPPIIGPATEPFVLPEEEEPK